MAKVRLGFADLAMVRPLTWALLKGQHAETFATQVLPHGRVAPLLAEGALDVGLVTMAELVSGGLEAIADLGVVLVPGGRAPNLLFRNEMSTARTVAYDKACPGTTAVAEAWVLERYGRALEIVEPTRADIQLISGPRQTIELGRESNERGEDLAQAYSDAFSSEPVTYVWAHQPSLDARASEFALKSSLRFGLGALSALAREVAAERSIDTGSVEQYFRAGLRFVRSAR